MRKKYYWDVELSEMKKTMCHEEAALRLAGYDFISEDFECNVCGETIGVNSMAPPVVVRGGVPVIVCLNCADEENLPNV